MADNTSTQVGEVIKDIVVSLLLQSRAGVPVLMLCDDSAGILQKWSKLRRRCASFKSVSGPASLDSDTNFILAEHPGHYQIISTATGSPIPPRAALVPNHNLTNQSKHQSSSQPPPHHHHHPLYHGHHHHHGQHPHHLSHRAHPHQHHHHHHHHHHQHHQSHLHQQQHQLHHHPLVDYPLPGSHLLEAPPLASGYDPKNWELRHSSSSSTSASSSSTIGAPPAIPATAAGLGPFPGDEYWQHFSHEPSDVKLWRLGAHQTYAHRIHVNPPQRRSAHSIDWEYNVQRYENMCDNMAPPQRIFRTEKLQYYDELADVKRTTAADTALSPGVECNGGIKVAKEIKLPSLKTFKSASMRLPGQKSSIHEVQQLLRSKFNRIHAGLRKRRALSVQEVFQIPGTTPGAGVQATPTKPTFYVPSPLVSERTPHRGAAPRYNEEDERDGTRTPFLDDEDRTDSQDVVSSRRQPQEEEEEEDEGPVSLPYISETMLAEATAVKKVTLRSTDHSPSPRKERTKTWYRSIDFNAALQKLDAQRHSLDASTKCTPKKQTEPEPAAKERAKQECNRTTAEESATKPNFSIGGRVSLRERVENMNLSRLRPSKMSSASGNGSPVPSPPVAVVKKISDARKIRPRSHSPLKNIKINLSPVKKATAGTPSQNGDKSSKRESIGLFGRLNRMMHQHGLGGLSSGDKPADAGARKQNGKAGSSPATGSASKNGTEDGSVTSAVGTPSVTRTGTDKAIVNGGNGGVSFGGNVSKQSTIQKLTQLSSCNRREQQQVQQPKTETAQERDRKSKQKRNSQSDQNWNSGLVSEV
uniref:Uncharacterized protein n=1 Tax=Anopheles minimus TaxID=112268 RepID=A0A182W280_9DIPT